MIYRPFKQQQEFLQDSHRFRLLVAAKRAGKSEPAYVDTVMRGEFQPGYVDNGIDPYLMAIIAPTENMLRRLVWPKFRKFAKPFESSFNHGDHRLSWRGNNTEVLGFTAEKISRMEGQKLFHVHLTEAFQMREAVFLEAYARISDSGGTMTIDGSLGPDLPNPKNHWIYKTFIEKEFEDARVWQWATADNPHFPRASLEHAQRSLNPRSFRQMYKIDWDVTGKGLVYDDFDLGNVTRGYVYRPELETCISIDWGWANDMACLFFQYDPKADTVYLFDEIVGPRITLDSLWEQITARAYPVTQWYCDIAGNQEREQTGISNVTWLRKKYKEKFKRDLPIKYRSSAVNYAIPIVRDFILNGAGKRRFVIDEVKAPKSVVQVKSYAYPEKDGVILNENPVKKDDHCPDAIRYYFLNRHDFLRPKDTFQELNRWKLRV